MGETLNLNYCTISEINGENLSQPFWPRLASVNVGKFAGCDCSRSMGGMEPPNISRNWRKKKDSQGLGRVDRRVAWKKWDWIIQTFWQQGFWVLSSRHLSTLFFWQTVHFNFWINGCLVLKIGNFTISKNQFTNYSPPKKVWQQTSDFFSVLFFEEDMQKTPPENPL